jgi:2-methylaconitate cis-trans-isomerase PrpF
MSVEADDLSRPAARKRPLGQTAIPCVMMRGGTSRGPFFLREDLPADDEAMKRVLLRVMGSPHVRQIDGIGGSDPVTSKVAMVRRSTHPGADVDYLFAQVIVDRALVDTSPPCGNMVTAVGPFAIEQGLVEATDPESVVRIWDVNTQSLIEATVQTPGGEVTYDGDLQIAGVNDPAASIVLNLARMAGAKTGKLFPTGNRAEDILGVRVSCVDMAMPCMFLPAEAVGKTGYETKEELDGDKVLVAQLQELRLIAGERMGLGDVREKVIPKPVLVARARDGGTVCGRYFMPYTLSTAFAVTGGTNMAVTSCIAGTVVYEAASLGNAPVRDIAVEHPQGKMFVRTEIIDQDGKVTVKQASQIRHARKLFEGKVFVPASVWSGDHEEVAQASRGRRAD